ncbi:hypothetical protein Scep_011540 [Stephania cephalantha]|uniref:Uncharacterized protein n=1 Tax=Stephania cephalantha TaxID=152367 RepID=A0AAP0JD73_9MAGN
MAQEEQQRCSNSSSGGGGRTTKKLKQRKIPQRGLGVAQLEKIRLEEQQKGNSHSNHQSTSAIVFAPPSPTDISSFRPSTPISPSNFEKLSPPPSISSISLLYGHNNGETHDLGVSAAMAEGQGHGFLPNMWSTFELNTDSEDKKLDPGLEFGQSVINESNQLWPPLLVQRKQEPPQPRQQYITSKVKLSMSIPQSSGLNLQIEPPSNQSYTSNFTAPLWHEEYKMIGMKRQWPFSLDNPPGPLLNSNFPPFFPFNCSNGSSGTHNFEPKVSTFREGPSSSSPFNHFDWRDNLPEMNAKKENGTLDTILTLGPTTTTASTALASKAKQPFELPSCHFREYPEFNLPPFQGYTEEFFRQGASIRQQPFYSFFPTKRHQMGSYTVAPNEQRCELEEGLDLTLKL